MGGGYVFGRHFFLGRGGFWFEGRERDGLDRDGWLVFFFSFLARGRGFWGGEKLMKGLQGFEDASLGGKEAESYFCQCPGAWGTEG